MLRAFPSHLSAYVFTGRRERPVQERTLLSLHWHPTADNRTLIGGHQDEQDLQSRTSPMRENHKEASVGAVSESVNQRKES